MYSCKQFWLALTCVASLSVSTAAQQTVDVASISGRIIDATGAIVPGAQVTATRLDTNVTASAVTDAEGRFRFPYLKIGGYEIVASLPGLRDSTRQLTLTAGAAYELPIVLALGGLESTVTVTAGVAVLEAARSQIAATVSNAELAAPGAYPDNPLPTYRQITAVGEPRAFHFGGRLRF